MDFKTQHTAKLWNRNSSSQRRSLFDATEAVLGVIEKTGPIDGILGFSQVFFESSVNNRK
jgi:hypothetical protein